MSARAEAVPVGRAAAGGLGLGRVGLHVAALVLAAVFMAPFLFTISVSLKAPTELYALPPVLIPAQPQWSNYLDVWSFRGIPFATFYQNSVLIAVAATLGNLLASTLSAYGFARFRWRGRDFVFMVLLSTLVLPEEVVIIPKFLMFHLVPQALLGATWIDTWWPLILPAWLGGRAFDVFLLRQFLMQIPREMDEAAVIDGAGYWQILIRVLLPLAKPAIAAVAIFSFLNHWNDFIHPLIYLSTKDKFPLSVGLRWFQQQPSDPTEPREHMLMAAALLMALPCIAIFFSMQRYFVRGIVLSGLKG
ncbi:MAG TPA: carbohydrate ABC transporter permease [Chloroflexota bacterium]|nr:carbohydrate ABC transporter permease [Chloroflexota bacterium]